MLTARVFSLDSPDIIPPAPISHSAGLPFPSTHPLHAAHEASARRKFIGRTSQVDAALLIADLNANNITLLPFTVDHLGGFGYFLHQFLFGRHSPPCPLATPPKPPWTHPNNFPHSPACFAYQRALCAPSALSFTSLRAPGHNKLKTLTDTATPTPLHLLLNGLFKLWLSTSL